MSQKLRAVIPNKVTTVARGPRPKSGFRLETHLIEKLPRFPELKAPNIVLTI